MKTMKSPHNTQTAHPEPTIIGRYNAADRQFDTIDMLALDMSEYFGDCIMRFVSETNPLAGQQSSWLWLTNQGELKVVYGGGSTRARQALFAPLRKQVALLLTGFPTNADVTSESEWYHHRITDESVEFESYSQSEVTEEMKSFLYRCGLVGAVRAYVILGRYDRAFEHLTAKAIRSALQENSEFATFQGPRVFACLRKKVEEELAQRAGKKVPQPVPTGPRTVEAWLDEQVALNYSRHEELKRLST